MQYRRMPIEVESPEQLGYDAIAHNLSESSVADQRLTDLGIDVDLADLLLCYGDHLGDPLLREQVVAGIDGLGRDDVLVTPGAAAALFFVATSLLGPGDHVVVVRTNYATNIETPRAVGADVSFVDLRFEDGYRLDLDAVRAALRPDTRLVSVTYPHNPTGAMLAVDELDALVELVAGHGAVLLVDETYRELSHGPALPVAATLAPNVVSVASMSKAYGLPGLRIGWALCTDPARQETLLAAKEQVVICGSTIDEAVAGRVLAGRDAILGPIRERNLRHLDLLTTWIDGEDRVEWVPPAGGVVCFPRIRPDVPVDLDAFYASLLADHGTYVGPGHWFEADRRHFRVGYGWPTTDDLQAGLAGITAALDGAGG